MLDWFRSRPACPVPTDAQAWIEQRMAWLVGEFGWKRLRSVQVILPTPEFFPDAYAGLEEDVRKLLDRVCVCMGLEPDSVELAFYEERKHVSDEGWQHRTAGLYDEANGKYRVWIEVSTLDDPLGLVGTMAHELGHVHLLGHGRLSPDVDDHEPLTDLLTVFLGLGVFTANSVIRESNWRAGQLSGWSIGRRGYLTMPMFGYAFALFAQARGESRPSWAKRLRLDVRSAYQKGTRFLSATAHDPLHLQRDELF